MPDIKYIVDNLSLLPESQLHTVEQMIKKQDVFNRTGAYVSDNGAVDYLPIRINLYHSVPDIITAIDQAVKQKFGSFDAYREYQYLGRVVREHYMRYIPEKGQYHIVGEYHLASLLDVISYVVTGKLETDYVAANRFIDANRDKLPNRGDDYTLEYCGVKLRKYKNGRLDIKFADSAHDDTLQKLLQRFHSFR